MADTTSTPTNGAQKTTIIEDGTELSGTLASDARIVVRGRLEGELRASALVVESSGAVRGRITTADLRSAGEIGGEIDAHIAHISGVVINGTVLRAKVLHVELAPADGGVQVIFGDCALEVGDDPSARAGVAPPATRQSSAPGPNGERRNGRGSGVASDDTTVGEPRTTIG